MNRSRDEGRLFPGGELTMRFAARVGDILHEVDVTYCCSAVPQGPGDRFRFAKYYYSNNYQYQWLHVAYSPYQTFTWSPSPTEFDAWLPQRSDDDVEGSC